MTIETTYESYAGSDDTELVLSPDQWVSQTFTVGNTGTDEDFVVLRVELDMKKTGSPTGNAKVEIWDASNPNVLATGTLDVTTLGTTAAWTSISFTTPAKLSASTQYRLLIRGNDGTYEAGVNDLDWQADNTSPTYTGGQGETTTNAGISFTSFSVDHRFRVYGSKWEGTLCEYEDVIGKTGANVASGLSTGAKFGLLNTFVLRAENVVNAITRKDWIAVYTSLTAQTKFILNEFVSNWAAIYAISYDMSGYTDRVEAETMINVLRDRTIVLQGLLKNQEVADFMTGDT